MNGINRQLNKDRSALPDVPAIYFVEPTSENVKRICDVRMCIFMNLAGQRPSDFVTQP
jgi:hypothetical protein